jgi:hypothetical protein
MEGGGWFHVPIASPHLKRVPVPIGQEAGWAPEPVWTTWRREISLAPDWIRILGFHPVSIPTLAASVRVIVDIHGLINSD